MKVRDSGMPEQAYWESLFDVELILERLGISSALGDVAELGCGYGTFTLPAARRISGRLLAFDIDAAVLARTQERAQAAGLPNVVCCLRDVIEQGYGLPPASLDAVLLFNILHAQRPVALLRQAAGLLRPGGQVLVIHWRCDRPTPRGPDLAIRPRPEQIMQWGRRAGLVADGPAVDLPPWHYGVRLGRRGASSG